MKGQGYGAIIAIFFVLIIIVSGIFISYKFIDSPGKKVLKNPTIMQNVLKQARIACASGEKIQAKQQYIEYLEYVEGNPGGKSNPEYAIIKKEMQNC